METLLQDIRYAVRSLMRSPGFTGVALLTLALGIGATTAIFTVVDAVLLQPLPYSHPERLAAVWEAGSRGGTMGLSRLDLEDWRARTHTFAHLAGYQSDAENVTGGSEPARVAIVAVTPDFFDLFGVPAAHGRLFQGADEGVVISEGLWRRLYGGAADAVGHTLTIDGSARPIIGILPSRFDFPHGTDLWIPLDLTQDQTSRSAHNYHVVGELLPGSDLGAGQADLAAVARRLEEEYPGSNRGVGAKVIGLQESLTGDIRPTLILFSIMAALVLLIATANVAGLLLVRAAARQQEMAIRTAVGAGMGRLVRQLLTESVLLATGGAGLGLLLATWVVAGLRTAAPIAALSAVPRVVNVGVLAFTVALAVITALAFGTLPSLTAARVDLGEALKQAGGRGTTRVGSRGLLIGGEVALATILLIGAGLTARSLWRLQGQALGFDPGKVTVADISFPAADTGASWLAASAGLLERVRAIPGVAAAGLVFGLPYTNYSNGGFLIEGRAVGEAAGWPNAAWRAASNGYFQALRIPVHAGRDFAPSDRGGPPVVMVNEAMARAYWPGTSPLGARIALPGFDERTYDAYRQGTPEWFTIVGIVGDVRDVGLGVPPGPTLYLSLDQRPSERALHLAVRTATSPAALGPTLRSVLAGFNPDAPIRMRALDDLVAQTAASSRLRALLIGLFALLAGTLAAVGIYGVAAYATVQRTREIGVRIALGASPGRAVATIMGRIALYAGIGLAIGLTVGAAEAHLVAGLLYGIHPSDGVTFAAVPLLFGLVSLAAIYLPARRATRVDPMLALRAE